MLPDPGGGSAMLFPHYTPTPEAVIESAAGVLLAAGQVDRVRQTVLGESKQAQGAVGGDLEIPMAEAPLPVDATADEITLASRFAAGALSKFAEAITTYDSGVDGLNREWNALPADATAEQRESLRGDLIKREGRPEATLDGEARTVAAMLDRGPNERDIKALEAAGLMPTKDLQLGSAVEPPILVKVGDEYVVMGSSDADHVQVIANDDGSFTIRVGTLVNGSMVYRSERVPPGQTNLEIRTYDGNDVIEVPPEVKLNIRAYAGSGDDNYFGGGHPGASVGGSGSDYIDLGEGDDVAFAGAGHDTIIGGDGKDVIDGQDGQDTIRGGDGFDTIYGGQGMDILDGQGGDDYVEGGSDDDIVDGGDGNDTLSGGRGDDILGGGEGNDHMFGGRGSDVYDGGAGYDDVVAERGEVTVDTAPATIIELVGSPGDDAIELYKPDWMTDEQYEAWQERIDSDLELIRTTPNGREGLEALDDAYEDSDQGWNPFDSGSHIRIAPYVDTDPDNSGIDPQRNDGFSVEDWMQGVDRLGGNYASPPGGAYDDEALVNYGPTHYQALDERPPVVSLYHELAHSYDQISGGTPEGEWTEQRVDEHGNVIDESKTNKAEFNSTGFDLDGDGDYDTLDSDGGRDHPGALTENALRDDLGWDNRESYTYVPGQDEDVIVIVEDDDGHRHRVTIRD
ncbi:MAG TPA: M91 family zinc metallopeptidase [Nocardioidaceae bacterium]|nr:M91 family zinc metallopeptidase [Nocardioidaceae bacterium]